MDMNQTVERYFAEHKEEIDRMLASMQQVCMQQMMQSMQDWLEQQGCRVPDPAEEGQKTKRAERSAPSADLGNRITREEFLLPDMDEREAGIYEYPDRAEVSRLRSLGYSVSRDSGLSDPERQELLRRILETGQMTKEQILSHLHYLIRVNGRSAANSGARKRWERDCAFVDSL